MPNLYWYEYRLRPAGPGCQPIGPAELNPNKGRWGLVAYDRQLLNEECADYDLRPWVEPEEQKTANEKIRKHLADARLALQLALEVQMVDDMKEQIEDICAVIEELRENIGE